MENEEWRPVVDYEGFYEVSSMGRVRSLDRKVNHPTGSKRTVMGKIRKPGFTPKGYHQIKLTKFGIGITHRVHRLVAKAFLDNPHNYSQVNHKNLIKTDNQVKNLEWCSLKQNVEHAILNGVNVRGEASNFSKLTEGQVLSIREEYVSRLRGKKLQIGALKEICAKYNISVTLISKIMNKKIWKHI